MNARQERGLKIAAGKRIRKVTDSVFMVPSQTHSGAYAVDIDANTCTCPDHEETRGRCKHLWAVEYTRQQVIGADGTTTVSETLTVKRVTYPQNWPAYNAAQCSEKDEVQRLLRGLCDGIVQPPQKGRGRPSLPLADVVYSATMKTFTTFSGRRASSDIRDCEAKGYMAEPTSPDPKENKKNKHAAALGRLGGLKGGKARAAGMTEEEKSASGKKMASARWGGAPKETHPGVLRIGDMEIKCAVLDNKLRVVSHRGFYRALATGNPGKRGNDEMDEAAQNGDGNVPTFLAAANLKPFISSRLTAAATPVVYREMPDQRMKGGGGYQVAHGLDAMLIPEICEVWLKARDAGALHYKQKPIAAKAEILMRGLARVGIIALIDEATGYQADKDRDDYARILKEYIAAELQPWIQRFPHEFFKQIHRLWGWQYVEEQTRGPRYTGKLINKYIYGRLPPGVLEELRRKNPAINGRRKDAHHQRLTDHTGIPHLDKLVTSVTTLLIISDDKATFESHLKRRFPKKGDQGDLPFPRTPPPGEAPKDEEE